MRTMHGPVSVSGCSSVVVLQQPTEPLPARNVTRMTNLVARFDQSVVQSLMIPLPVVVLDVFSDRSFEWSLTKEDHAIEAL